MDHRRLSYSPCSFRAVVVDVRTRHAIEGGASTQGVGPHVREVEEVPHTQLWQLGILQDLVQAITCGTPNAGQELHGIHRGL